MTAGGCLHVVVAIGARPQVEGKFAVAHLAFVANFRPVAGERWRLEHGRHELEHGRHELEHGDDEGGLSGATSIFKGWFLRWRFPLGVIQGEILIPTSGIFPDRDGVTTLDFSYRYYVRC